jgi:hypothetical protein
MLHQSTPDYECPVCYTTDLLAGVVSPACGHRICITCYSTVLLQGGSCPSCRADYPRSSLTSAPASTSASTSTSASASAPTQLPPHPTPPSLQFTFRSSYDVIEHDLERMSQGLRPTSGHYPDGYYSPHQVRMFIGQRCSVEGIIW